MRRLALLALLVLAASALEAPAAQGAEWHSEQPVAAGIGVPVSLGQIGDIEFQAPNRGMLITAGNGGVPAGLFAYDGTGWYRYSTVCGGREGRIAWAGPNEFWTISDQPLGQETGKAPPEHISLCHFRDGQVVASYAEPVGQPGSYLPMNAAACSGPDNCWFAGDRLPGTTNVGAFHLHWDGTALTAIPSLTDPQPGIVDPGRSVEDLAFGEGGLYESVAIGEDDTAPGESGAQPSFLHRVLAGAAEPFQPLSTAAPVEYGGSDPTLLEAFRLSRDEGGLWAIAGALDAPAKVTALRLEGEDLEQVALSDSSGALGPGTRVGGLAAEPGGGAWVGFRGSGEGAVPPARLTRLHPDGTVEPPIQLPAGEEERKIGRKGAAGPIACPGEEQCWMATAQGWLFHLGASPAPNTDPALHVLVSFRPPDNSLPSVPPVSLPEDDSGAELPPEVGLEPTEALPAGLPRRLYSKLRQRLIGKSLLVMTFVLHSRARVRLVARRQGHVVAQTPRYTMSKGPRRVRLRLDPERWPTKLDLQVHAIKKKGKR